MNKENQTKELIKRSEEIYNQDLGFSYTDVLNDPNTKFKSITESMKEIREKAQSKNIDNSKIKLNN